MSLKVLFVWHFTWILVFSQVNIEQYRSKDGQLNKKFRESFNISTSFKRSTSSLYSIGFKYFRPLDLSYANGLFLTKINYGKSNQREYINDVFYHIRFLSKGRIRGYSPEAFIQYEHNKFSLTHRRYLAGLGVRYLYKGMVQGTSIMNEWYRESSGIMTLSMWRLSQYISLSFVFNPFNRLTLSLYVQPSINDFTNIRYYSETTFMSQVNDFISYNSSLTAKFFSKSRGYDQVELFFESGFRFKL